MDMKNKWNLPLLTVSIIMFATLVYFTKVPIPQEENNKNIIQKNSELYE